MESEYELWIVLILVYLPSVTETQFVTKSLRIVWSAFIALALQSSAVLDSVLRHQADDNHAVAAG